MKNLIGRENEIKRLDHAMTENEAQLIKDMIDETTRNYFGCTPQEFVEEFSDDITIGGI